MVECCPLSSRDSSSAIGAVPLRNGACPLPCGGSPPIYVGSFPFSSMFSHFLAPPSTSIKFNPSSTNSHHFHLARIKLAVMLSNQNPTSQNNNSELCSYEKRPPPEPPPLEETKFLRACVCVSGTIIVLYCYCYCYCLVCIVFIVLSCYCLVCIVCLSLVSFKSALKVFDVKPQRCLNVMENALSKDLIVAATSQSLFFSIQQMNPSHVASFTIFESPNSRSAHPQAKEMIRNWIDLKTVVPQPSYHLWKKFAWVLGLSYWLGTALLASNFSKFIDTQILVGLIVFVGFRMWLGNVLAHCMLLWLYFIYSI